MDGALRSESPTAKFEIAKPSADHRERHSWQEPVCVAKDSRILGLAST
jgi:hypothetical protein